MWNANEIVNDTYIIMNELGRGGTGVIYLAYHMRLEKYVVLKRIKDNYTNLLKVRTEVDILKKLRHTYLPQVYDFMQYGDQIYTVIDYIDGYDLDKYLQNGYTFTQDQLVLWLRQLCDVLDYLHKQKPQILHCDIKPGNIMITSEGNVCLIDFNVSLGEESKSELSGISQYYASPEQYEKAMAMMSHQHSDIIVDQRTDIYSLGATIYHLISGIQPTINAYNTPLSQMGLFNYSPEFLEIIDRMMTYDRNFRYKSVSAVLSAIDKLFKTDRAFKRLILGVVASVLVYAVALVSGVWMCSHGNQLVNVENYNTDFGLLENYYEKCDYGSTVSHGIDMLNNSEYTNVYKNNVDSKIEVLRCIGESYFYIENYSEACRYYKEAVDLGNSDPVYTACIRDYAIALIRNQELSEARIIIDSSKAVGLKNEDLDLIDAELFAMDGDYSQAAKCASALTASSDEDIRLRAYLLAADSYGIMSDYEAQITYLADLINIQNNVMNYRRLGDAYIKYAEKLHINNISARQSSYNKAVDCYERVVAQDYCSVQDMLNLSVVYMELERYSDAVEVLCRVIDKDDTLYRSDMLLAFCYDAMKDHIKARDYCLSAVQKYERTADKNKEPHDSDNIRSLYELEQKLK